MARDSEPEVVEAIFDALEREDPAEAWDLARHALATAEDDPVLHYLGGQALLELDRAAEAVARLRRATELEPSDGEFRVHLAWALYRACRFDESLAEIDGVGKIDPPIPDLHFVRGLCVERTGDLEQAEIEFRRATDLDPESFPAPSRFSSEEFERQLDVARSALPDDFRRHLDSVTVLVEDLPAESLLLEETPPLDPEHLLGLFQGVPLNLQDSFSPGGELPPRIYLFKRNLERYSAGASDLAEQIRVTLFHELGHYLGLSEEELEQSGYA